MKVIRQNGIAKKIDPEELREVKKFGLHPLQTPTHVSLRVGRYPSRRKRKVGNAKQIPTKKIAAKCQ